MSSNDDLMGEIIILEKKFDELLALIESHNKDKDKNDYGAGYKAGWDDARKPKYTGYDLEVYKNEKRWGEYVQNGYWAD